MALLRDFLASGRLGPVELGMTSEQVVQLLGEPDDESARKRPTHVLRYGAAELTFKPVPGTEDSRLVGTALHVGRGDVLPPPLRLGDWTPSGQTTEQEVRAFLATGQHGVHSSVRGEQVMLVSDTGASVTFDDGHLVSLHFRRRDRQPERTQVTVSLPDVAAQTLKRRAREDGVTVSQLIENIVQSL